MTMEKLSNRQQQIYNFIARYCTEKGFCPSLADVAQGLDLHNSTIAVYVNTLKQKGVLTSEYRVARSLRTVEQKPVADLHTNTEREEESAAIKRTDEIKERRPLLKS